MSQNLRARNWAKKPGESLNNWCGLIFKPERVSSCCHLIIISRGRHHSFVAAMVNIMGGGGGVPSTSTWGSSWLLWGSQSGSYTRAVTNTVLSPPLLTVASGNTHPSPGRAAGHVAITFSPVDLYFPGQPQTQRWWCSLWGLFLMARILKMFLVVPTWEDVHLYCVGMWADTRANAQVVLSPWADGISLTLQKSLNVFVKMLN